MQRASQTALTIPELVLAMSITAMIGLAVGGLAAGLSYAHSHTDSLADAVQSGRAAMMSMEATLRRSKLVTATGAGALVAWMGDTNSDKSINLDELVLLEYQQGAGTVEQWQVVFPDSMGTVLRRLLNRRLSLSAVSDPATVRRLMSRPIYSRYLSQVVIATDVQRFEVGTNRAPPLCRLVLLRLSVGQGAESISLSNAVRLRADLTGSVRKVKGSYVLDL